MTKPRRKLWCRSWRRMTSNTGEPIRVPCNQERDHTGPCTGWVEGEKVAW